VRTANEQEESRWSSEAEKQEVQELGRNHDRGRSCCHLSRSKYSWPVRSQLKLLLLLLLLLLAASSSLPIHAKSLSRSAKSFGMGLVKAKPCHCL